MQFLIIGGQAFQSWLKPFKLETWFSLRFAATLEEVEDCVRCGAFQGVYIDLDDSSLQAKGVLQALAHCTQPMAVVGLHAETDHSQQIEFLEHGGHILLEKTMRRGLLFAKCTAAMRLAHQFVGNTKCVASLELHFERGEVRANGQAVPLTALELRLIETLILAKGRVITAQSFFDQVYFYDDAPSDASFKVLVCKTRSKLEKSGLPKDTIKTVRGLGYSLPQKRAERSNSQHDDGRSHPPTSGLESKIVLKKVCRFVLLA